RFSRDWSSDVCSSDLPLDAAGQPLLEHLAGLVISARPPVEIRQMQVSLKLVRSRVNGLFIGLARFGLIVFGIRLSLGFIRLHGEIGRASCRERSERSG